MLRREYNKWRGDLQRADDEIKREQEKIKKEMVRERRRRARDQKKLKAARAAPARQRSVSKSRKKESKGNRPGGSQDPASLGTKKREQSDGVGKSKGKRRDEGVSRRGDSEPRRGKKHKKQVMSGQRGPARKGALSSGVGVAAAAAVAVAEALSSESEADGGKERLGYAALAESSGKEHQVREEDEASEGGSSEEEMEDESNEDEGGEDSESMDEEERRTLFMQNMR